MVVSPLFRSIYAVRRRTSSSPSAAPPFLKEKKFFVTATGPARLRAPPGYNARGGPSEVESLSRHITTSGGTCVYMRRECPKSRSAAHAANHLSQTRRSRARKIIVGRRASPAARKSARARERSWITSQDQPAVN